MRDPDADLDPGSWTRTSRWLFALLLVSTTLRFVTPPFVLHPDTGWFLYAADAWNRGLMPYRDIVEVNPPLVLYLHWIPVALARALDLEPRLVFRALFCGFWLLCYALAALSRPRALRGPVQAGVLLMACLFFVGLDYGQREHFLLLAAAPWLMLCLRRDLGEVQPLWGVSLALGLLAGCGFALKPQCLLMPALIWAWQVRRLGWRPVMGAPENLGLLGFLSVYALHLPLLPFAADLAATGQLAWASYGAYRADGWALLELPFWICVLLLTDFVGARDGAAQVLRRQIRGTLLLACLGALLAYLLQGKGWRYHLLPLIALVAGILGGDRLGRTRFLGLALLLCVSGFLLTAQVFDRAPGGGLQRAAAVDQIGPVHAAVRTLPPGSAVLVLDTGIPSFFAYLVDHRLHWSSRYACLWPLPEALAEPAAEGRLRAEILADLDQHPPDLLYLPRGALRHVRDADFDLLSWLGGAAALQARGFQQEAGAPGWYVFRR